MADKKVTQLSAIQSTTSDDLLYVVNNPKVSPASTKISVKKFFGSTPNTAVSGTFSASGNASFTGTTLTISANTSIKNRNVLSELDNRLTVTNAYALFTTLDFAGRYLEVANANYVSSDGTSNATVVALTANSVSVSNGQGLTVNGGGIGDMVPASSNASTEGITAGTIWFSNTHLYIATDENTIKRVALSTF